MHFFNLRERERERERERDRERERERERGGEGGGGGQTDRERCREGERLDRSDQSKYQRVNMDPKYKCLQASVLCWLVYRLGLILPNSLLQDSYVHP